MRNLTHRQRCFHSVPDVVGDINRWLQSWSQYFRYGHPRRVFRWINWFVIQRLARHLNRRCQRRYRIPAGQTLYVHLQARGLQFL